MALGRIIEMTVGKTGTEYLVSSGETGVGLDITFKVERSNTLNENSAIITVYNAKKNTREEILSEGNNVILKAGYLDDGHSSIFIGNIANSTSIHVESDWITTLECTMFSGEKNKMTSSNVSISYAPGSKISQVLSEIADALGLSIQGLSNADINLKNGLVFAGNSNGALRQIKKRLESNGVTLYKDNGQIIVYKINGESDFEITLVDNETRTLISLEEVNENEATQKARDKKKTDKKRIKYTSILIPTLKPGSITQIGSINVAGRFVNEKVDFIGGTREDDEFVCECEAIG